MAIAGLEFLGPSRRVMNRVGGIEVSNYSAYPVKSITALKLDTP